MNENWFAEAVVQTRQHYLDHLNDPPPKFVLPDWFYDMVEAKGYDMRHFTKYGDN